MLFAKKNKTELEVPKKHNIDEVYVLKTYIVSDIKDGTGAGPRCITCYFLAKKEEENESCNLCPLLYGKPT